MTFVRVFIRNRIILFVKELFLFPIFKGCYTIVPQAFVIVFLTQNQQITIKKRARQSGIFPIKMR